MYVNFILLCAAVAYVVRILLLDGTVGPFQSKTDFVVDGATDGASADPVDLWDQVRRLFGVYRVEDTGNDIRLWHTTVRADLWRCPKCLSFWVTFLASAPFIYYYQLPVYYHLSMVFVVQFMVFVQLWFEGE